jgi:hypothetical protein
MKEKKTLYRSEDKGRILTNRRSNIFCILKYESVDSMRFLWLNFSENFTKFSEIFAENEKMGKAFSFQPQLLLLCRRHGAL